MLSTFRKSQKGFTLVELMIVVAIIGILAALAIPAFLRYIKSSKTAEAEGIMKKISDGSKAYFTSEQKYSDGTDGDQPWHAANAAAGMNDSAGMPVPWGLYQFPGGIAGATLDFNTTDGAAGLDVGTMPKGGSKQIPFTTGKPVSGDLLFAVMNKLNVNFEDPMYFQYRYEQSGQADTAAVVIQAGADFGGDDGDFHTITQNVTVDATSQEVEVGPSSTTFEFE